uniref:Exonuclease domain-containing protein n=2 Tax=Wuchereria bancrofti TaxID=6293 RepID=A0A1I8F127_WUCBA
MVKVPSNKERRKMKKLKKNISEVLLLSGDDPTTVDLTSVTSFEHSFDDKDITSKLDKKLRTMRHLKDPPKISLSLDKLNGVRLGSHNIAELVHYVSFHNVDKPLWISLRPSRAILQAVIFRIGCNLEMVESNKKDTYIGQLFGPKSFIRMQTEAWNSMEFWTSMLNVPLSKFERLKRIVGHTNILEKHIKSDVKGALLVTLRQMVDFCYPFPKTNRIMDLTPIVPTKEKYGVVKADSPFFAVDCEMCTTETGESELTRISIVDECYEVLLDTLVKPRNRIVDYVTKYSGITEKMLENVNVRVEDVQRALSHILPNDAILVGHTLECDFNAMRITHPYCIDISLCLNLSGKDRQRSSLKTLARIFLNEEIQGENGHCSVDDAVITMRLLKYKLSHGIRFGNVSLGWSFDDWARENGLTTSGARIDKNKHSRSEAQINQEPQQKKRCLDIKNVPQTCGRCGRPLSVACIVPYCACKKNVVKYCVICCLNSVLPQTSSEEPTLIWSDAFQTCTGGCEPILHFLRLDKGKSAFCAIPGGINDNANNEHEIYLNTNEYDSLEELVKRVNEEMISHNVVMVDINTRRLKMKVDEKPIVTVDNALRRMISYASWNSLIIVVFSSPQESLAVTVVCRHLNVLVMLCRSVSAWANLYCGSRSVTVLFLQACTLPLKNDEEKSMTKLQDKLEKKIRSLFRRDVQPNNLSYPNKYMRPDFDPAAELKDIVTEMPAFFWNNTMELAKEMKGSFGIYKPKILEDLGSLRHGQFRKDISFKTSESFKFWRCGADSDSNEGFSKCEFIPTDRKTALFRGTLSTELIKDGRIERAGWAAIKFEDRGPFLKKKYFSKWSNYSHFLIKCRGDGRTYKISLNSPLLFDVTWGDAHSYYLHTHGGPYWQYEAVPFSKFIHTVRNRIMDKQYPIKNINVSSLIVMLMDRIDGDFSLEIDYIGVVHDRSHVEEHSYESYHLPILFAEGI